MEQYQCGHSAARLELQVLIQPHQQGPGIGALALTYVAAILPTVKVQAVADPDRRVSAKQLALSLPNHAWRTITWRDGSAAPLRSRFARVQVRTEPSTNARHARKRRC
jgi:hypothetical protein